MIRYNYINNLVLQVYKMLSQITFPLNVQEVVKLIPNCKIMSYQKFAEINNCTINDVIQLCESKSGCTHYDKVHNRYLILCNLSTQNNNNSGRQLWTCFHEVGHILCKHLSTANQQIAENGLTNNQNLYFENEADYFAATILSPFPLFKYLHINSPIDIQNVFGLSAEASLYRYKDYLKWLKNHRKTSWENDIVNVYWNKLQSNNI